MTGFTEFTETDLRRIESETFVADIVHFPEVPSTNDVAMNGVASGERLMPRLVLADRQTAGRGRGGNRWWSQHGGLTFSLIFEMNPAALPKQRWPQVSLAVGLAVCQAAEQLVPGIPVGVKWPNDVYVAERKLCGVLIEVSPKANNRMVIGVGINVNNTFEAAPEEIRQRAVSLAEAARRPFALVDVLIGVLRQMHQQLDRLVHASQDLAALWHSYCMLSGRHVVVEVNHKSISGKCLGIDPDGALRIATSDGIHRCVAGVVSRMDEVPLR